MDRSSIRGLKGLIDVVTLPDAVAVVTERYWQARQALRLLRVAWDEGGNAAVNSGSLARQYREAMEGNAWLAAHSWGDGRAFDDPSLPTFSAEYESQFLAHATMEPMNATAHVTADGCEVWAPTQGQELTQLVVAQVLGLPNEKVRIHRTLAGGGFGRRLLPDFVLGAALASRAVGRPVNVIWSPNFGNGLQ